MSTEISTRIMNESNTTANGWKDQWDGDENQIIQMGPTRVANLVFPFVMIVIYMSIACWFACPNQNMMADRAKRGRRSSWWNNSNEQKPASKLSKEKHSNKRDKTNKSKKPTTNKKTNTTEKNLAAKAAKKEVVSCSIRSDFDLNKSTAKKATRKQTLKSIDKIPKTSLQSGLSRPAKKIPPTHTKGRSKRTKK